MSGYSIQYMPNRCIHGHVPTKERKECLENVWASQMEVVVIPEWAEDREGGMKWGEIVLLPCKSW